MATKHWTIGCCASLILGLPALTLASKCDDAAAENPSFNYEHFVKNLKNKGYKLQSLKPQCHFFVVQAWDKKGRHVLMYVDAKTGDILERQNIQADKDRSRSWLPALDMFDEEP